MDNGIGGSADGHVDGDRVFQSLAGHDVRGAHIFPHHFDNAAAAHFCVREAARIWRGDVGGPGESHPESFGQTGHGAGGAHDGAVAGAAGEAAFDFTHLFISKFAGAVKVEELAAIGAGAKLLVLPLATQHGTAGDYDSRDIGAGAAHKLGGRGLVTAA